MITDHRSKQDEVRGINERRNAPMKRRRQYKDFDTPQEYLNHVLNTWTEFCWHNAGLAQAISDLLAINAALAATVKVLVKEKEQKK